MSFFGLFGPPDIDNLKAKGDVKGLIKALSYQADYGTSCWNAARALGQLKDPRAIDPLMNLLKDSRSTTRKVCVQALGEIGDPRAIDSIIQATFHDSDRDVRHTGCRALREIGNDRTVGLLITALENEPSGVSILAGHVLVSAYEDNNNKMHQKVVEKLGSIRVAGIKPLIFALMKTLKKGGGFGIPPWAEEILKKFGSNAVEPLTIILKSDDRELRCWAADALGIIGDPLAVEPLITALGDSDAFVLRHAIRSLKEIGGSRSVEGVIAALYTKYGVYYAAEALGEIGDLNAVEPLIAQLNNLIAAASVPGTSSTATDQKVIITALGKLGDVRAVDPLIALLDSSQGIWILEEIITALGRIGDARPLGRLLEISAAYPELNWDTYKDEGCDLEFDGYSKQQGIGKSARTAIAKIQEKNALLKS